MSVQDLGASSNLYLGFQTTFLYLGQVQKDLVFKNVLQLTCSTKKSTKARIFGLTALSP